MSALETDLIEEIKRLPIVKRYFVIEEILKSIKNEELNHQMGQAADELYNDYLNDKNLTGFTALDFENFYEAK